MKNLHMKGLIKFHDVEEIQSLSFLAWFVLLSSNDSLADLMEVDALLNSPGTALIPSFPSLLIHLVSHVLYQILDFLFSCIKIK